MEDEQIIEKAKWFECIFYDTWLKSSNKAYEQGAKGLPFNAPVNVWRGIRETELKKAIVLARKDEKENQLIDYLQKRGEYIEEGKIAERKNIGVWLKGNYNCQRASEEKLGEFDRGYKEAVMDTWLNFHSLFETANIECSIEVLENNARRAGFLEAIKKIEEKLESDGFYGETMIIEKKDWEELKQRFEKKGVSKDV